MESGLDQPTPLMENSNLFWNPSQRLFTALPMKIIICILLATNVHFIILGAAPNQSSLFDHYFNIVKILLVFRWAPPLHEPLCVCVSLCPSKKNSLHPLSVSLSRQVTWTLGNRDTWTPGHWDIETLGYRDTGIPGHWDTRTLGHRDTGTLEH